MINTIIHNSLDNPDNYIVGFADLDGLHLHPTYKYGIVIGKRLDDDLIDNIENGPTLPYHDLYNKTNSHLSEIIHDIEKRITDLGYGCQVVEPSIYKQYRGDERYIATLRTAISHKMIATRAGLGWIGKTDLFISKKFGPRIRLVSLLTDYTPETIEKPIDKSRCGKCEICVTHCPANAASGQLWDIYTDRDEFYDPHKCKNMCENLTKSRLDLDSSLCGICVSVCPVGKKNKKN